MGLDLGNFWQSRVQPKLLAICADSIDYLKVFDVSMWDVYSGRLMTTDRILTLIGIILGIPAFLSLFIDSKLRVEGVLTFVIIALVIVYRFYKGYRDNLQPFTVIELRKNYVIYDALGTSAKCERIQRMKANLKNVSEFWCRNIVQDGTVDNFLLDGVKPELEKSLSGTIHVGKHFLVPLVVDQEVTVVMTCDYHNSFTNPQREGIIHVNSLPTEVLIISVQLPKPCLKAEAYKTYGGQAPSPIEHEPVVTNRNQQIELKVKRPLMGASYHLDWTW